MIALTRPQSLARKALILAVLPAFCALVLLSLSSFAVTWFFAERALDRDLDALATIVRDNVSASLAFDDKATATEIVAALKAKADVSGICVFTPDGALFAAYAATGFACPPTLLPQPRADGQVRVRPVSVGTQHVGTVLLVGNKRQFSEWLLVQALALGGTAATGGLVALLLARRMRDLIISPIRELALVAETVTRTADYALRAPRSTDDEVGALADAFNAMLTQVQTQSRLKDEFLAVLSHELRTPLNAITGWLRILRTESATPDVQEKAFASMERNARAQVKLIEDLLDISGMMAGRIEISRDVVDVREVVTAAVDSVTPEAEAKGIRLESSMPQRECLVLADRDRLRQVFGNILSNAMKFTEREGHVHVQITTEGDMLVVAVRDTGAGISPEFLPHVFERFRQSDGSSTRRHGGLGLGLAIVKELVERHGGSVRAASAGEGQGATLSVRLPRWRDPSRAVSQETPASVRASAGQE